MPSSRIQEASIHNGLISYTATYSYNYYTESSSHGQSNGTALGEVIIDNHIHSGTATYTAYKPLSANQGGMGIDHNGNNGNDPMRGGRQSQRDQSIKRYPKEFQRWYHKEIKPDVHPGRDATPEELEEGYQDWLDLGRPAVKTVATGFKWGLIGWGAYEGIKWGAAIILAPETGGGSLVGAGALP